jgi:hypothetical protein
VCVQSVVLLILAPEMQLHSVISLSAGTNVSEAAKYLGEIFW